VQGVCTYLPAVMDDEDDNPVVNAEVEKGTD